MVKAKVWIKAKKWSGDGKPKLQDIKLVEEELPALKTGEYLAEAEFLSVDPYNWAFDVPAGSVMIGGQVAKVTESKNEKFPVGSYLFGHFGWRTHTVSSDDVEPYILPDLIDLPRSLALGALGMPGNTAYFGFLEICQPKSGETLVVSAAGGAVGSLVGQIGKLKGLNVIGITGSNEKCDWLVKELGFDYAINYKTADIAKELEIAAPNGVDCYFDNVGGELSRIVIDKMNDYGRVSICGCISMYGTEAGPKLPVLEPIILFKQLKIEGFVVSRRWKSRWMEGIMQMLEWIKDRKIKYRETVTEGFENMPQAFTGMIDGASTGKAIIKI